MNKQLDASDVQLAKVRTVADHAAGKRQKELEDLIERLEEAVRTMREEGRFSLEQFLDAAERGYGGTLVWKAPHKLSKRSIPEAGYQGERYGELSVSNTA